MQHELLDALAHATSDSLATRYDMRIAAVLRLRMRSCVAPLPSLQSFIAIT